MLITLIGQNTGKLYIMTLLYCLEQDSAGEGVTALRRGVEFQQADGERGEQGETVFVVQGAH